MRSFLDCSLSAETVSGSRAWPNLTRRQTPSVTTAALSATQQRACCCTFNLQHIGQTAGLKPGHFEAEVDETSWESCEVPLAAGHHGHVRVQVWEASETGVGTDASRCLTNMHHLAGSLHGK
jgi:hypothetical protein